ncbi:MAG: Rrf2 family transcriptional regulator [Proteobacteria bacterium]|nr:Rrf2 family transcriptional regulator [Pseudomonadota bacterium]
MKLSTKCRYGIRAIIEIARNYKKCPTKRKEISSNQGIPDSYLENILIDLKHNNIVVSIRGAGGGFMLKRSPDEISMLNIVEALQGSLALVDCIESPSVCKRIESCVVRPVWIDLQKAQENVLQSVTIKELLDRENYEHVLDFNI